MALLTVRSTFLDFFKNQKHVVIPGSSLVPYDESLLFTNAGMNQFKPTFAGEVPIEHKRVATIQPCLRAGGKHNDLENVGHTRRHHTLFEMLGNFSFGDYFKEQAIAFAYHFITQELNIPKSRLWVSVFEDDDEAADIWIKHIGIEASKLSRCGAKDNFWSMGDTGPCGPCSEIFYDQGHHIPGGPPGSTHQEGDRYLEIWNLVFMQYNRQSCGQLDKLPNPCVDTGMGLERIEAVLQGVLSNYETKLFKKLIKKAAEICQVSNLEGSALKVIADHIRAIGFLITDGIFPSNEGRGYVLRRIIRRAYRYGYLLGVREPFLYKLLPTLIELMGQAYPRLIVAKPLIEKSLKEEEVRFSFTLEQGMSLLEASIAQLKQGSYIGGEVAFKLYDSFGFPLDLTQDIAKDRGLYVDVKGFEQAMSEQKKRSRVHSQFHHDFQVLSSQNKATHFTGYNDKQSKGWVKLVIKNEKAVTHLSEGEKGLLILDQTPFYAESGGQVGDSGVIKSKHGEFIVEDTQKSGCLICHHGWVKSGVIKLDHVVEAQIDEERRLSIARNHSATHLLHAALRSQLGKHITQQGSLVQADRLRFDFSHQASLSLKQMQILEHSVNAVITKNLPITTELMPLAEAKACGAMSLFNERYGETVRVLKMGDFSLELCGGTHVKHTGEIGLFKLIAQSSVASGIRRVEAVTGQKALKVIHQMEIALADLAANLKTGPEGLNQKLKALLEKQKHADKKHEQLLKELIMFHQEKMLTQVRDFGDFRLLAYQLPSLSMSQLRKLADKLKQQLSPAIVLLATTHIDKLQFVCGVTRPIPYDLTATKVLDFIVKPLQGSGGGRPEMAQGGANTSNNLSKRWLSLYHWVEGQVNEKK